MEQEGWQASDWSSRLCFDIYKCDTTKYFIETFGQSAVFCTCVCGNQTRYFKPIHDLFLTMTVFFPKPNKTISTAVSQNTILKLNLKKRKLAT